MVEKNQWIFWCSCSDIAASQAGIFHCCRSCRSCRMESLWKSHGFSSQNDLLVGGDWNHGILNDFPLLLGME